jgi:hypothetical protein
MYTRVNPVFLAVPYPFPLLLKLRFDLALLAIPANS